MQRTKKVILPNGNPRAMFETRHEVLAAVWLATFFLRGQNENENLKIELITLDDVAPCRMCQKLPKTEFNNDFHSGQR